MRHDKVDGLARYRSDPSLAMDNDRFNVEDLLSELDRKSQLTSELSGVRSKLRMRRGSVVPSHQAMNSSSVTELSDIVAANSADSGVEVKPELFSLLNRTDSLGRNPRTTSSPPLIRHMSLPRHVSQPRRSGSSVASKTIENHAKSRQSNTRNCDCQDCQTSVIRSHSQRYSLDARRRPLPPEPVDASDSEEEEVYYNNDVCSCCYGPTSASETGGNYERLAHRSYKGQPPALRRGQVVPPRQSAPPTQSRFEMAPEEDVYTSAFSGDSTLLRAKSTKKQRAPDPPVHLRQNRPVSMITMSTTSEKENDPETNYLAKEKSGALVIVNRNDLEAGLLNGTYIQYDVAPPLLLDQAMQNEPNSQCGTVNEQSNSMHQSSLLMTVDDTGHVMEAMSVNYDSGVSPANSSSATGPSFSTPNTGSSSASHTESPPLLPPRNRPQRSSHQTTTAAMDQVLLRRQHSVNSSSKIDITLRELASVSPPSMEFERVSVE